MLPFFMGRIPCLHKKNSRICRQKGWGGTNRVASIYRHTRIITHTNKKHI